MLSLFSEDHLTKVTEAPCSKIVAIDKLIQEVGVDSIEDEKEKINHTARRVFTVALP